MISICSSPMAMCRRVTLLEARKVISAMTKKRPAAANAPGTPNHAKGATQIANVRAMARTSAQNVQINPLKYASDAFFDRLLSMSTYLKKMPRSEFHVKMRALSLRPDAWTIFDRKFSD